MKTLEQKAKHNEYMKAYNDRMRSDPEYVAKRRAIAIKYARSEKGKAASEREANSEKGRNRRRLYDRTIGAAARRTYRNKWVKTDTGKQYVNRKNAEQRAYIRQATPSWLTEDQLKVMDGFYQIARMLTKHNGELWTVDHKIPFKGEQICGLNVPWNMQLMPGKKNFSKHNKLEDKS